VIEIPGDEISLELSPTSFQGSELLLGATLLLSRDDPEEIATRMETAKSQRMSTHRMARALPVAFQKCRRPAHRYWAR